METCPGCFTGTQLETAHTGKNGCKETCHGCQVGGGASHNYDGGGCENPCIGCRDELPENDDAHRFRMYGCRSACAGCIDMQPRDHASHKTGFGACQSTCYGCHYARNGQKEHMDEGGCLAIEEEEEEELPAAPALPVYGLIPERAETVELTVQFRDSREVLCTQSTPVNLAVLTALTLFNGISKAQAAAGPPEDETQEVLTFKFGYNSAQYPSGMCDLRATEGVIHTLTTHLRSPTTRILYGGLPQRFQPEHSEQELADEDDAEGLFNVNPDPTCSDCERPLTDWGEKCDHCESKKRKRKAEKEDENDEETGDKKKRRYGRRRVIEFELNVYVDGVFQCTQSRFIRLDPTITSIRRITRALYRLSMEVLNRSPSDFDLDEGDILYEYNTEQILAEDTDTLKDVGIYGKYTVYASVYLVTKDE